MKYYYTSSQAILRYMLHDPVINALLSAAGITFGEMMRYVDLLSYAGAVLFCFCLPSYLLLDI